MSEARDRYYKCLEGWGYVTPESREYVAELEKQLTELKESQKQKQIIRLCERLDEAEQQKAELIEALRLSNNCINHARAYLKNKTNFQDNGLYKLRVISNEDLIKNIT